MARVDDGRNGVVAGVRDERRLIERLVVDDEVVPCRLGRREQLRAVAADDGRRDRKAMGKQRRDERPPVRRPGEDEDAAAIRALRVFADRRRHAVRVLQLTRVRAHSPASLLP